MTKQIGLFLILFGTCFSMKSQINTAYLNKNQKETYSRFYTKNGIRGYIEYEYPSEKEISKGPARYSVVFLDSLGNIIKSILYAQDKTRANYYLCEHGQNYQITKKYNYTPDNTLFGTDEFIYNPAGELVESIQRAANGSVSSRTKIFYDKKGFTSKAEMIGQDGKTSSTTTVKVNAKGLPTLALTKHVNGFVMSTDSTVYNEKNLPVEKITLINITGRSFSFRYSYNSNNLVQDQISYRGGKADAIKKTEYFGKNFSEYLKQHGFNLSGIPEVKETKKTK